MRKFFPRRAAFILFFSSAVYICLAFFLFVDQSHQIYHPTRDWVATPSSEGLAFQNVEFSSKGGGRLSGWFVPAGRRTVLFCHGNARNISSDISVLRMFHDLGVSAFIFDYRGFGKSPGIPKEEGTYADAEGAWNYLVSEREKDPMDIIIWGRSLGSAVATELALRHRPKALVLEAAFTSLADLAAEQYPFFPVRWILRTRYDNLKKIARVGCPVLIVHSREDQLIPLKHGKELFGAAAEPKCFLEIKGPHNGLPHQPGYEEGLRAFLDDLETGKLK